MTVKTPTDIVPLDNLLPEEPLLMMGAGPVPIPDRVANANSIVINHLGETMSQVIEQVKAMSRYVFQTESQHILGVAGPGSAAMEMAVVNIVSPQMKVLSIVNGFFSERLAEMAERAEGEVVRMNVPDGQAASVEMVEEYLQKHKPSALTIVQGETSNTVFNRYLPEISAIAQKYECMMIVDAVCTLSTMTCNMDEWKIDAVITGGQKGLSSIPGVSLVAFSDKAWDYITSRKDRLRHWCLDAVLADQFWYKKSYHYTAPVSGILAMHEALRLICLETLQSRIERHLRCSTALQAGIETMGLNLLVEQESRLNSVVGVSLPEEIQSKILLDHMSDEYRVEISGFYGSNIVRIGQMGEQSREHNLFRTIHAFGSSLKTLGLNVDLPGGMAALESKL